jgi:CheY-like chemotaxis protein
MATVLIVDDSQVDRRLAGGLLARHPGGGDGPGLNVLYADNGMQALEVLARDRPDLVLTDMQMPEMNGLELVEAIRSRFPLVPIILMTAHGSEELAIQALQRGASSYVPKRNLARDLLETVEGVLTTARSGQDRQRLLECLTQTESHFVLENDPDLIPPLLSHLRETLARMNLVDETGLIQVSVALGEALANAMYHGNLEVGSEVRERNEAEYQHLIHERRRQKPYRDRRVYVSSKETLSEVRYVVRDEGPGFDPSKLPDPTHPGNLEKTTGRGLLLIRTFMGEVFHNEAGNQITMVKRRER